MNPEEEEADEEEKKTIIISKGLYTVKKLGGQGIENEKNDELN